ncbi:MAG: L,D-transpeptidase [Microcystis sp.]|jgi:L,D-transpeptidase ErfK/SrfK|uniref:L,D-transpeptidase n=1 Tax=Microcystis aeruginosa Ma_OC_H_19870700_S124 TaxID=2486262 RepID=A0A552AKG9_MICAE|nr:L,D-transpeptidase [Microcystis aeruginosa LG13-13]NCR05005.1 L,D-transpeptidase [Microcystis aeruginosa LG13-03]NCR61894.1 L,D-transpeptidase [Microcystis aeruginosa LG11-05]NCR69824.1 L,D-transpeptidase [Microcystis aeruginosa LG13-12]TRT85996.1 MAG: L,D-transpeptidase [Microcystis aeruginosa Ma_OC_H_19870700_S124]
MRVFLPILCLCLGMGEFLLNPPISPVNSLPATTVTRTETRLLLNLKKRRVFVYQGQKIIASYPVAIGRRGWETPTGEFRVIQMVREPVWEHPFTGQLVPSGKNNPLGARWLGFWTDGENFIGFHGTPPENLIGRTVCHGCVRMRDRDIKALFEKVQIGTSVIVIAQ